MVTRFVLTTAAAVMCLPIVFSQEFKKDGMLRATTTLVVGKPFAVSTTHAYVKGELEYQLEETWSLRGDTYYNVGNIGGASKKFYDEYHSVFAGVSYHFTKEKQFDPYLGIQAGVLWSEVIKSPVLLPTPFEPQRTSIDPLASLHGGFNYYAKNYFHLFMNIRYLYGIRSGEGGIKDLSEIRFSFGLGFNINVKKKRKI